VKAKLIKKSADEYNLLVTILKLGMQKVVFKEGHLLTKLTFRVDASEATSNTSSSVAVQSSSVGINAGYAGRRFRASGSFASNRYTVNVVNETSTSVLNVNAEIIGEVRIDFATEAFPSIDAQQP
jgi:hypothetical protein